MLQYATKFYLASTLWQLGLPGKVSFGFDILSELMQLGNSILLS
jgi:hypothetical protein